MSVSIYVQGTVNAIPATFRKAVKEAFADDDITLTVDSPDYALKYKLRVLGEGTTEITNVCKAIDVIRTKRGINRLTAIIHAEI